MNTAPVFFLRGGREAVSWDFLTNHAHVLVCVSTDPGIRQRDIASAVGITERATHKVLSELIEAGYVVSERQGRRNHYTVDKEQPLRHPLVDHRLVGDLLEVLGNAPGSTARARARARARD
jgi:predicted ArsR family transcriptional regulator